MNFESESAIATLSKEWSQPSTYVESRMVRKLETS